jgi:hypothetical protein
VASIFAKFFGRTVSDAAGFAAGIAVAPALHPVVQEVVNHAWAAHPIRPPDVGTLAVGVAEGKVDEGSARAWAEESGYGGAQMDAFIAVAKAGPGVAEAFRLWRRREIDETGFRRALTRQGLAAEWIDALWAVRQDVLDPADLARGIHRGLVPDPGLLQGELPAREGNVPAYPVYPIDALGEAEAAGYDRDHLGVLVGLQGNPMGAHEAASALFRGILTPDDYLRAIAEGNTRNEWAAAIREQTRQLPTAREFLENALRGYRTLQAALDGAALHGMTHEHALMVYQNQGRPMNVRQITQALARGGKFEPEPGELTDPYEASIVEGNLKPGYYDLARALRYTLPSVFAIRQLAQSGVWDEAKTRERLLWWGWIPEDAADVAHAWASGGGGAADPHVTKAQTQLWTALHKSYVTGEADETIAADNMTALAIPDTAQTDVLALWDRERELVRKQLTPAQIRKAYKALTFTEDVAVARLVAMGYSLADARTFLHE